MNDTVLKTENLTRYYDVSQGWMKPRATLKALNGVSLSLHAGSAADHDRGADLRDIMAGR